MSGEFSDNPDLRFSVKELILDLRNDVRALRGDLDLKADRDRVHALGNEVAAIKMIQAARENYIEEFRKEQKRQDDQDEAIEALENWRNRIIGATGLGIVVFSLFSALAIYIITGR